MGVLCGKMEAPTATYEMIALFPVEIRTYPVCFVAEIQCTDDETLGACDALMEYIGLFGEPKNVKGSMDPGVLQVVGTHIEIARILPVLREDHTLQILLPLEYTDIDQLPVPTDPRILIRSLPERSVAVTVFHGAASRAQYMRHVERLVDRLDENHLLGSGDYVPPAQPLNTALPAAADVKHGEVLSTIAEGADTHHPHHHDRTTTSEINVNKWTIAQYHSHSTLFCCRRNEVWIQLEGSNPRVAQLLSKTALQQLNRTTK